MGSSYCEASVSGMKRSRERERSQEVRACVFVCVCFPSQPAECACVCVPIGGLVPTGEAAHPAVTSMGTCCNLASKCQTAVHSSGKFASTGSAQASQCRFTTLV